MLETILTVALGGLFALLALLTAAGLCGAVSQAWERDRRDYRTDETWRTLDRAQSERETRDRPEPGFFAQHGIDRGADRAGR